MKSYRTLAAAIVTVLITFTIAQAQWTQAVYENLTTGPENDQLCQKSMGIDNQGTIHVVFDRIDTTSAPHNLYYLQKPINSSWTVPAPIGNPDEPQSYYQMKVDKRSGKVYVAFFERFTFKLGIYDGIQWQYHDLLIPPDWSIGGQDLDVDNNGRVHFTFEAHNDQTEAWQIGYGYWDGTEDFHFQVLDHSMLIEAGLFAIPLICAKTDGSVAIVFRNFWQLMEVKLMVAKNSSLGNNDWTFEDVNVPGIWSYSGQIETTPNNDIHLLIHTNLQMPFPGQIYYARQRHGTNTWEWPVLTSGDYNCRHPRLNLQNDGIMHIACHQTQGLYSTGNLLYLTNQSGTWTQSPLVTGAAYDPCVDLDQAGNGSIVYRHQIDLLTDSDISYYGFIAPPGPTPPLEIVLTPTTVPIQIPNGGGAFNFDISVINNSYSTQNFDVWCDVTLPDSTTYGPLIGPVHVTAPANFIGTRDRTQMVPGNAPAGIYVYNGYVGIYPDSVIDQHSFTFEKWGFGSDFGSFGWENQGASFGDWAGSEKSAILPASCALLQNFPNPFNPTTTIRFDLPEISPVTLTVYNIDGGIVGVQHVEPLQSGTHEVTFDGSNLTSGIYFCRLQAGEYSAVQKLILLK